MSADTIRLRELARWQREFAEVSSSADRDKRRALADYLDRRADELEGKGQGILGPAGLSH